MSGTVGALDWTGVEWSGMSRPAGVGESDGVQWSAAAGLFGSEWLPSAHSVCQLMESSDVGAMSYFDRLNHTIHSLIHTPTHSLFFKNSYTLAIPPALRQALGRSLINPQTLTFIHSFILFVHSFFLFKY